jgi:hypothetical protein
VIHHIPQFIAVHHRSAPPLPSSPHDAEEEVEAQEQVLERQVIDDDEDSDGSEEEAKDCVRGTHEDFVEEEGRHCGFYARGRGSCDQGDKEEGFCSTCWGADASLA